MSPRNRADRLPPLLVVDDEVSFRAMLRAALEHLGYQAEEAGSVREAVSLLRTRSYSLVLCDYDMPGASGLELLRHLTETHSALPFVMLTGCREPQLAARAVGHGALDFLAKPFHLCDLPRVLEQNWARLEWNRRQLAADRAQILSGTIRALVAAVDAKDPCTAHHSERVTRLALMLGEAAGLDHTQLRVLEFAALLHDVGKIAVPDGVLLKPGPLEDEERDVFRRHPVRGAEIASKVVGLEEVASIIRHHHERYDGAGYPDGLSGEAIPYLCRIVSLSDVYEALTADRSYRRAMSADQARQVIASGLGTQFDPRLGTVFLSLVAGVP